MSVALQGALKDFGIADVFQLIGQQRKSGLLILSHKKDKAEIAFDQGSVVWAAPSSDQTHGAFGEMLVRCGLVTRERVTVLQREADACAESLPRLAVARGSISEQDQEEIESLLTRDTIFTVLRWTKGNFDFRAQEVEHHRPPHAMLGAEQILMDGLRMVDEWNEVIETVASEDDVYRPVEGKTPGSAELRVSRESADRIFRILDARLSARRVIDLARMGTFEGMQTLAALVRAGVVEIVDQQPARSLRWNHDSSDEGGASALRVLFAALVPLLLLGTVTVAVLRHVQAETSIDARAARAGRFEIPRSPLESVRATYGTLRLRNALEARYLADGVWPQSLAALDDGSLLTAGELAGAEAPLYYYARLEEGALLLAPEL